MELVTMFILGSSDIEIAGYFVLENIFLTLLGLSLGTPIGFRLTQMIVNSMFPVMVYLQITFELGVVILIFLIVISTSLIAQIPALRSLFNLDLSEISKEFLG
jgi:ABC-type antimicrobial peptide transport system permease subunit